MRRSCASRIPSPARRGQPPNRKRSQSCHNPQRQRLVPRAQGAASCDAGLAKQAAEKGGTISESPEKPPSGAKARVDSAGFMRGLKPPPPSGLCFSATCKASHGIGVSGFASTPYNVAVNPEPPLNEPSRERQAGGQPRQAMNLTGEGAFRRLVAGQSRFPWRSECRPGG